MQNILRSAFALTVAAALTLAAGGAATARTSHGLAAASATPSTCTYDGLALSSITAAGPSVREQAAYRRHHQRQWVRYTAGLQALSGTSWKAVPHSGRHKVKRLHTWATRMPALTLAVPAGGGASAYRVTTTVRWYKPDGRHVARKQSLVLTGYSSGATSCLARKPAPGSQGLAVSGSVGAASTGQSFGGAFTVSNLVGSETVTSTLYGPQTSPAGCSGTVARQTISTVGRSGTYSIPTATESVSGYYFWGVASSGNGSTSRGNACASAPVAVRRPISISVSDGNRYYGSGPVTGVVSIAGFDRQLGATWTGILWGPYGTKAAADAAGCTGTAHTTLVSNAAIAPAAGSVYKYTLKKTLGSAYFWRWGATFNGNGLESAARTCSATFHTLKTAP